MFVLLSEIDNETFYFCTLFQELILMIVLFQTALSDLESGNIPNKVIITGLIFIFPFFTPELFLKNLTEGIIVFVLFLMIWKFGFIGGGDVKLIALIALVKGVDITIHIIILGLSMAAICNGVWLFLRGNLYSRFINLINYIKNYSNEAESYVDIAVRKNEGVPLAGYIFFSNLLILAYSGLSMYKRF